MDKLAKTLSFSAALGVGLMFISGAAFATACGGVEEPPCEPPTADCSPGYYKKPPENCTLILWVQASGNRDRD